MSCVVSCVLASLRGGEVVEYLHTVTEVSIFTEHTNKNRTVLENSLPHSSLLLKKDPPATPSQQNSTQRHRRYTHKTTTACHTSAANAELRTM